MNSVTSRVATGAAAVALLAALAWPIALHTGAGTAPLAALAGVLTCALLLRLLLSGLDIAFKAIGATFAAALAALVLLGGADTWLRWQPTALNLALLAAFASSLLRGMPLIERIARARRMPVAAHNLTYLRGLTAVWSGFFALAAALSAWAAMQGGTAWRNWNGFGIYAAIAVLLIAERLFRIAYRSRLRRQGRLPTD